MNKHVGVDTEINEMIALADQVSERAESWADGIADWMTLMHLTPFVLGVRVPKLIAETRVYSPFDREETRLAVCEKVEAVVEGAFALQLSCYASLLQFQASAMEGRFLMSVVKRSFDEISSSALTPAVERLRSNAERLG